MTMAGASGETAPPVEINGGSAGDHFVQFYESDAFLVESVCTFVGAGLGSGERALIVATAAHRNEFEAGLAQRGLDLEFLKKRGDYVALDAAETLEKFMVRGMPDAERFRNLVGGLVGRLTAGDRKLRVFGEMVALLWAAGKRAAAITLEQLWNDLGKAERFTLFCAYPMSGFRNAADAADFKCVCGTHARVLPSEAYGVSGETSEDRLRSIAILQQQAAALQSEVDARRRAEVELRRQRHELQSLVDHASIGLHWVDARGTIVWANAAELAMLGYTHAEYIGHHIAEFHADQPVIDTILARLCRGETLHGVEARLKCKNGDIKTVCIDSSVLWDNGRFVHTQCFTRDVTREKQEEVATRRLAAIVESSDDAIISKDLNGIIMSWNSGAQRIFGYTAEEVIGKPVTILMPPERVNEEPGILARIRRGERIDHYETIRMHKNGHLIDISLTVSPVRDASGRVVGISKTARDITERRRIELQQRSLYDLAAAINRSEELSDIYNASLTAIRRCEMADRAAILLFDADGVMRFKAAHGLSEAYRKAVEGHSPWKPGDPDPRPVAIDDIRTAGLDPHLQKVVEDEGIRALAFIPLRYHKRLLGKFMIYYNAPHRFEPDALRPAEAIASQVSFAIERQKDAEALESLVDERTKSLREAVAQMEEFSYTVSHDLRAPLRGMQVYSKALLEDYGEMLDVEAKRYVMRIEENATRLDKMVLDVLTFSRLARTELKMERVSLDKLVRELVQHYPGMQPPRAEVRIDPLSDVVGHEPSITQAVSNLLSNAVKFVAPGVTPNVHVWTERKEGAVRLWVADNGIGIDPVHHSRLYNMFERVHPNLRYDGTGVGLAIVRKAVSRMGGETGLESDGKNGSRFWIQLPAPTEESA
jgi:PAS domain S-box-containing protein